VLRVPRVDEERLQRYATAGRDVGQTAACAERRAERAGEQASRRKTVAARIGVRVSGCGARAAQAPAA
jgi:hypothetical protein